MKKLLLACVVLFLASGIAGAATIGCYFGSSPEGMMSASERPLFFDAFVFVRDADYYVTAVEYQLVTPLDPAHAFFGIANVTYPENVSVALGDPFEGHSIAFWPPLNGFVPGYNLICTLKCFTLASCAREGGVLTDYPVAIGPNPRSGELRGTFAPENDFFPILGLTALLCPEETGTQEESWGAIASLYR